MTSLTGRFCHSVPGGYCGSPSVDSPRSCSSASSSTVSLLHRSRTISESDRKPLCTSSPLEASTTGAERTPRRASWRSASTILVSGHSVRTPGCSSSSGHSAFSFARLARKSSPTEVDSRRARSLDASTVARCMDMSSSGVASSEEESDAVLDDDARVVTLEHAATEPGPKPASPPPGVDENWGVVGTNEGADVGGQGCAPGTCRGVDLAVTTRIFGGPGSAPSMLARCSSNMCAAADVSPGFNQVVRGSWKSR